MYPIFLDIKMFYEFLIVEVGRIVGFSYGFEYFIAFLMHLELRIARLISNQ